MVLGIENYSSALGDSNMNINEGLQFHLEGLNVFGHQNLMP